MNSIFNKLFNFVKSPIITIWEGGGFLGRLFAIILGIIGTIILFIIWLLVLTFEFGFKIVKVFLEEIIFFMSKITFHLTILNDLLDELITKRVMFYLSWLMLKIFKTSFFISNSQKEQLSSNILSIFFKNFSFVILWVSFLCLFSTFTLAYPFYTILYLSNEIEKKLILIVITRILILTPILFRFIRLRTMGAIILNDILDVNSPFWTFNSIKNTFSFREKNIAYIIVPLFAMLAAGSIFFVYNYDKQGKNIRKEAIILPEKNNRISNNNMYQELQKNKDSVSNMIKSKEDSFNKITKEKYSVKEIKSNPKEIGKVIDLNWYLHLGFMGNIVNILIGHIPGGMNYEAIKKNDYYFLFESFFLTVLCFIDTWVMILFLYLFFLPMSLFMRSFSVFEVSKLVGLLVYSVSTVIKIFYFIFNDCWILNIFPLILLAIMTDCISHT